jgi:outer membrane receptor for ferrienterochelin and colicins
MGALALSIPSPAAADLVGVVRDASSGRAIGGAIVRVQASGAPVFTDVEGRYALPVDASGVRVAAGAKGYFSMGLDAPSGASVDFALEPVPHDPARPVELADPTACVGCHAAQVEDWKASAMAHAGRNTWVEDLYMGTGTPGGAGGFVYTRDSVHAGKNPASECASCHQPESWVASPFSPLRSAGDPHPSVERGVSCLTCHLVAHVDEARPNDPGIFPGTVQMNRGSIVRYGVLGDVDFNAEGRMRASYQPQLSSAVCGACHQDANDPSGSGKFDGPISEPTYLEWLHSPYADPTSPLHSTCMGCHSEPSNATSASSLQVTAPRPPGQVRTHRFEGTTPDYLERAVSMSLETKILDGVLEVSVALTNRGAGHHVPTGVTSRNAILLVEASRAGGPLEHVGTERVSELGGVGSPERGYFAGLPGKMYATVNETAAGVGPTLFTDAARIRSDTRIPALATDRTVYPFRLEGTEPVRVRARLIYRRAWRQLVDAKGWSADGHGRPLADLEAPDFGHLMASAETTVTPPTPRAPDVEPVPSVARTSSGCSSGGRPEGRGTFAALLAFAALAASRRRRRARGRAGVVRSRRRGARPAARGGLGTAKTTLATVLLLLTTAEKKGHAQGPAEPSVDKEPDTVVVTGTRTPELSQRATVKTDVVTREEAERRGATNVGEALSTQPGVRVDPGAYGYLGGVSAIQIQGFDLQRVLILEDGEPVVGDVGGAIDLAAIPLADVERIEIVTGPTSALYGSSAIGGVVNIITAPPRREGPSARVRAEGRSHEGLLLQGGGAYRKGGAWIGLEANAFRQDGIARTPGLPDLQVPEASRFMLGARGGAKLSRRVDVRVRARWFRDRLDGLSSKLAPALGRYLIEEPNDTDRYTLHVVERLDLGGGSSLRLTLGRQWVDNTTAQRQQGSPVGERHDRSNRMHSAEVVGTIADGARTWVVGGRAEVETFEQTVTTTESLSSGLATRSGEEVTPQTLGRAALYGQLEWKLGESLTLLPGVRAERHMPRYGGALTPRLAMSYRPASELQVRASAGRGFRAPSAKELGFVFDHSSLGYRVLGNPDLVTESSWGVNGDVTWRPARAYTLRAGGFMNWVDDMIDLDLAGGVANGAVVDYRYVNFGRARTFGAQIMGSTRFGDRLRADVSYDYLWTRDDLNDRPLGGRPPHTVTASLRATLAWKLEANARWRLSTPAFVSAETRSPGYQTIDLRLARELWAKAQAYLGVLNVTDVHQLPGRVGDLRPPLGRVFYVGIRAELPWEEE